MDMTPHVLIVDDMAVNRHHFGLCRERGKMLCDV